ncbi:MAG: FkbM family methyltransferase [Verrucomicrobia bacterium]|nr:FkbM family methyltransferase [Verrucomicrobiota bacterium]
MSIVGKIKDTISTTGQRALGLDGIRFQLDVALERLERLYHLEGKLGLLAAVCGQLDAMHARLNTVANQVGTIKAFSDLELSDSSRIGILHPEILGGQRPADFVDYSRLANRDNLIVLISEGRLGNELSWLTLGKPSNSQQRAAAYARAAKELANFPIDQILAVAKNAEGLFAAIAIAEISGSPLALILVDEQPFLNDRSGDSLLSEAIEKAGITFSLSLPLCASVQANLGKRLWFLPDWFTGINGQDSTQTDMSQNREILAWLLDALQDGFPPPKCLAAIGFSQDLERTVPYVDPPPPKSVHWSMHAYFQALHRLSQTGYKPEFVVDVGASTGSWSHLASRVFPESRFYLVEPLLERYQRLDNQIYSMHPEFVAIAAAAGDQSGQANLNVSSDLYSSSFLDGAEGSPDRSWEKVQVPIRTLDEISSTLSIKGQGILKIDVQMAEHLVLDGANHFLKQIDVVCLELSLDRFTPSAKTLFEMLMKLHALGFEYFDTAGSWRQSRSGRLIQQDTVFVRSSVAEQLAWS